MSIIKFLEGLFPFLVSAARKTFDKLEDAAKEAGINGSLFSQIIKENTEAVYTDVENLLKQTLKLSDGQFKELEDSLRKTYNIPDAIAVTKYLQNEFHTRTDDILHNSFANELFSVAAVALSKGKLNWLTLAVGLGEYIYRKFVKGKPVVIMGGGDPPKCPAGKEWNPITKQCQDPIG